MIDKAPQIAKATENAISPKNAKTPENAMFNQECHRYLVITLTINTLITPTFGELADEGMTASATQIVPFATGSQMTTILVAGIVGFTRIPVGVRHFA